MLLLTEIASQSVCLPLSHTLTLPPSFSPCLWYIEIILPCSHTPYCFLAHLPDLSLYLAHIHFPCTCSHTILPLTCTHTPLQVLDLWHTQTYHFLSNTPPFRFQTIHQHRILYTGPCIWQPETPVMQLKVPQVYKIILKRKCIHGWNNLHGITCRFSKGEKCNQHMTESAWRENASSEKEHHLKRDSLTFTHLEMPLLKQCLLQDRHELFKNKLCSLLLSYHYR